MEINVKTDFQTSARETGVTLLEMIVVLAIVGIVLATLAEYKRNEARERAQQNTADIIIRDISGLMDFVKKDEFEVINSSTLTLMRNPLYKSSAGGQPQVPYNRRGTGAVEDPIVNNRNNYFSDWTGIAPGNVVNANNNSRRKFLGTDCDSTGTSIGLKGAKLANSPLVCNLPDGFKDSELIIERIDFINNQTTGNSIDRVDVYLLHRSSSDEEQWNFSSYINALDRALAKANLTYEQAYVVKQKTPSSADKSQFEFVLLNSKPLELGQFAANIQTIARNMPANARFGIRLSIRKTDAAITASGNTRVDKMCWNTKTGSAGPCIESQDADRLVIVSDSGSSKKEPAMCWDKGTGTSTLCLSAMNGKGSNGSIDNDDDRVLHLRSSKIDDLAKTESPANTPSSLKGTTATLYANVVMENTSRKHPASWTFAENSSRNINYIRFYDVYEGQYELVTPATVFYQAFKQSNSTSGNRGDLISESGSLELPVQKCPRVEAMPSSSNHRVVDKYYRQLYPRLSVALSSVAGDGLNSGNYFDYASQGSTRTETNPNNVVGAIGGVATQVNLVVKNSNFYSTRNPKHSDAQAVQARMNKYGVPDSGDFSDWLYIDDMLETDNYWLISATSAMTDINGGGKNKINPSSLSVIVTQWCSTIPQSGIISNNAAVWVNNGPDYLLTSLSMQNIYNGKFFNYTY